MITDNSCRGARSNRYQDRCSQADCQSESHSHWPDVRSMLSNTFWFPYSGMTVRSRVRFVFVPRGSQPLVHTSAQRSHELASVSYTSPHVCLNFPRMRHNDTSTRPLCHADGVGTDCPARHRNHMHLPALHLLPETLDCADSITGLRACMTASYRRPGCMHALAL